METKTCSVCSKVKKIEEFSWKVRRKGVRQHHCKQCQREYCDKHYQVNSERYIGKAVKRSHDNKHFIFELKDNKPCVDCKAVHRHFALDFDHRDPKKKILGIAEMYSYSKEAILKEVAKCDLICANCHRYRTFKHLVS